jgi:CMP-N-acetylneuraminic acid synthetase
MKIVSLIPARGGSKEIPDKNIINLKGKPLIYYTIQASKNSSVDETWVSTNSSKISVISEGYGANIIKRPNKISKDDSKSEEALLHFAKRVDFDILVFIQATSPLLTSEYINIGLDMMKKYDSVFSVTREHWIPRWNKKHEPDGWDIQKRPMRQDVEEKFLENGAFYITKKQSLLKSKLRYSGKIGMVEMPLNLSFQIDTQDDLELVGKLL